MQEAILVKKSMKKETRQLQNTMSKNIIRSIANTINLIISNIMAIDRVQDLDIILSKKSIIFHLENIIVTQNTKNMTKKDMNLLKTISVKSISIHDIDLKYCCLRK